MAKELIRDYIEEKNAGLYVKGTRVSLASVIHKFQQGCRPEEILEDFPALQSLENVCGAITFCLANPDRVVEYLADELRVEEMVRQSCDPPPQSFIDRVKHLREERMAGD